MFPMISRTPTRLPARWFCQILAIILSLLIRSNAASIEDGKKLFLEGKYKECIRLAEESLAKYDRDRDEEWPLLLSRALAEIGKYAESQNAIRTAIRSNYGSIRLRLEGYYAFMRTGRRKEANSFLEEINEIGDTRRRSFRDPLNAVALGRAAILLGADPRLVLDNFFEPAKKADPKLREVYLAIGELGLEKAISNWRPKTSKKALSYFQKTRSLSSDGPALTKNRVTKQLPRRFRPRWI